MRAGVQVLHLERPAGAVNEGAAGQATVCPPAGRLMSGLRILAWDEATIEQFAAGGPCSRSAWTVCTVCRASLQVIHLHVLRCQCTGSCSTPSLGDPGSEIWEGCGLSTTNTTTTGSVPEALWHVGFTSVLGGTACPAAQTINTVVLYSLQRCHPASCRRNTLEQVKCKTLLTDWPWMHAPII